MTHKIFLRNITKWISQYHQIDYLPQEQGQKYYSKLIQTLIPSKNQILLFEENSNDLNDLYIFQQKNKNVILIHYCNL